MVGLECGHKLAGWSKAGVVSNFCSVGSHSKKELKYSCSCSLETRDPTAPKGEQELWKSEIMPQPWENTNSLLSDRQTVGIQARKSRASPRNN